MALGKRAPHEPSIFGWFFPLPGWRTLPVALSQKVATSFSRLHECFSQRRMRSDKMIVRPPPLQMGKKLRSLLGRGPGAACER